MRPATLIQIHYHNRPGGVTTVMAAYGRAFAATAGPGARVVTVCHDHGRQAGSTGPVPVVSLPDCDYRAFRSARALAACRRRLLRALERVLDQPSLPRPVCVVAHNLPLGKNLALAAAYADLVRRRSSGGTRFFAIVHDLAEEGRPALLGRLRRLAARGVPVWQLLYPHTPGLTYVTPAPRIRRLLARAGYAARELFDPVDAPALGVLAGAAQRHVRAALARVSRRDGVVLPRDLPLALYPSRVIGRKNPLEAVVVACLVLKHALAMGAPGTSREDQQLCAAIRTTCRRLGLPVLIDAVRVLCEPGVAGRLPGGFRDLCFVADICISTSVLEGFGYALYEPWAYGRAVVGRRPRGFRSACGVDHSMLYERMMVPRQWVGAAGASAGSATVDFADLDRGAQVRALERLVRAPESVRSLRFARPGALLEPGELAVEAAGRRLLQVARRNRRGVLGRMGAGSFRHAFARLFFGRSSQRLGRRAGGAGPLLREQGC